MTKKRKKRIMGWLMAFMMLISVFPTNIPHVRALDSYAAEGGAASPSEADPVKGETVAEDETGEGTVSEEETAAETENIAETENETEADGQIPVFDSAAASASMAIAKVLNEESRDRSDALFDFALAVKRNGTDIPEGGTIESGDEFSVTVNFKIPVEGDSESVNPVLKGDKAVFDILNPSAFFELQSSVPIPLKMADGTLVGHATFETDSDTEVMQAHVLFDGDEEVFNGDLDGVGAGFYAEFKYNGESSTGEEVNEWVTILDKTYKIYIPEVQTEYKVTKKGTADLANKKIQWTVNVTATRNGKDVKPFDLEGYKFYDDLKTVGAYITGSLQVNRTSSEPDTDADIPDTGIRYTFKSGQTGPAEIVFETKIPDDQYYAEQGNVTNAAELKDSKDVQLSEGSYTVSFKPTWIDKKGDPETGWGSGGEYNPKDRTITWTITANQMAEGVGADLNDVFIKDVLPANDSTGTLGALTLDSAVMQIWDSDTDTWSTVKEDIKDQYNGTTGEFSIGHIKTPILLTIVTKIPDPSQDYQVTWGEYHNTASIRWDGMTGDGYDSTSNGVGVGFNGINKEGIADPANQSVHWTVTTDTKEQDIPDLKVYDLLIYGSSGSGADASNVSAENDAYKDIIPLLTARYDQKYDGNFSSVPEGSEIEVVPVYQDETEVGQLLVVTKLKNPGKTTLKFDTKILNPDIYASNTQKTVSNTAFLFSSNAPLTSDSKDVSYRSSILDKEMLHRDAMGDPAAGVNNVAQKLGDGFDYNEKAVIFRLSINANGMDFSKVWTDEKGTPLGVGTVTDTLPLGWEFVDFNETDRYLVFEGAINTAGGSVTVSDTTAVTVPDLEDQFIPGTDTTGATATFTFDPLTKPYVILIKARPTDAAFTSYLDENKAKTVENTVTLKAEKGPEVSDKQGVTVNAEILAKSHDNSATDGELIWTVDYKPFELSKPGSYIEDTLSPGMELRTDSAGKLLVNKTDDITAYEMELKADGTYTVGNPVTLEVGKDVIYDNALRKLRFNIPDGTKAYRFMYVTDITAETGTLSNHVELHGVTNTDVGTNKTYDVQSADGWASGQRRGQIYLDKTDGLGYSLPDAEFTLYAVGKDGIRTDTVIRKGTTEADKSFRFKTIPEGSYILKETVAPAGYMIDDTEHLVTVSLGSDNKIVTTVDGTAVSSTNPVKLKNYADGSAGSLTIHKTVAGDGISESDKTKEFEFVVTFENADGTYNYTRNGVADGTIKSGDKVYLIQGQNIKIAGLPIGAGYKVDEVNSEGYEVTVTPKADGTISAEEEQSVSFTNTKNKPETPDTPDIPKTGKLTISKTVSGSGASTTKAFDFTVTLNGAEGTYEYTGNGVSDGTIKSGDTISLAHGQSITIKGLPEGATYAVTETNYSGYKMESAGAEGTISADSGKTAAFTNTRTRSSSGGGGGSSSGGGPKVVHTTPGNEAGNVTVENPADDGSGLLGAEIEKQDPTGLLGASVNRTPKTGDDGLRNIWLLGLAISVSFLLVSTGLRITVGSRDRRRRK